MITAIGFAAFVTGAVLVWGWGINHQFRTNTAFIIGSRISQLGALTMALGIMIKLSQVMP